MISENTINIDTEKFTQIANVPALWIGKGYQLLVTSLFLKDNTFEFFTIEQKSNIFEEDIFKYKHFDTVQMLRAMALECYLKGTLLITGTELFVNGKLKKEYKNHGLRQYAEELKMNISKDENRVIVYMQNWIYAGRYPVAASYTAMNGIPKHPNIKTPGKQNGLSWSSPSDDNVFNNLIERIIKIYNKSA